MASSPKPVTKPMPAAQGSAVRVVRVLASGTRRGPATEAQGLYEDLAPRQGDAPDASPLD